MARHQVPESGVLHLLINTDVSTEIPREPPGSPRASRVSPSIPRLVILDWVHRVGLFEDLRSHGWVRWGAG